MSVIITNVSGRVDIARYEVRINDGPVLATFDHNRDDGLVECLRRAAEAISRAGVTEHDRDRDSLTGREVAELRYLRDSDRPLFSGVPPEKADRALRYFISRSLVQWTGKGYVITDEGRRLVGARP